MFILDGSYLNILTCGLEKVQLLNYVAKKSEFLHFCTKSRFSQNCVILAFFNFRYTSRVQILFKFHQILNICFRDDYGGTYQINFEKIYFFRFYGHFCAHDFLRISAFFKKRSKKLIFQKREKVSKFHLISPSVFMVSILCQNLEVIA